MMGMSVSLCLSAHVSGTTCLNFTEFFVHDTMAVVDPILVSFRYVMQFLFCG